MNPATWIIALIEFITARLAIVMARIGGQLGTWIAAGISAALTYIAGHITEWIREILDSPSFRQWLLDRFNTEVVALAKTAGDIDLDPTHPLSTASLSAGIGHKMGLQLNPADPFSKQSLAHAFSLKLGLGGVVIYLISSVSARASVRPR